MGDRAAEITLEKFMEPFYAANPPLPAEMLTSMEHCLKSDNCVRLGEGLDEVINARPLARWLGERATTWTAPGLHPSFQSVNKLATPPRCRGVLPS